MLLIPFTLSLLGAFGCVEEDLARVDPKTDGTVFRGATVAGCATAELGKETLLLVATHEGPQDRAYNASGTYTLFRLVPGKKGLSPKGESRVNGPSGPGAFDLSAEHWTQGSVEGVTFTLTRSSDGEGTTTDHGVWVAGDNGPLELVHVSFEPSSGSGYPSKHERLRFERMSNGGGGVAFLEHRISEKCDDPDHCAESQESTWHCYAPGDTAARASANACWVQAINASSSLQEKNVEHGPELAVDGRMDTAWVEGAKGAGVGEWLEVTLDGSQTLTALELVAGYAKSAATFANNNRIRKVKVTLSNGTSFDAPLQDKDGYQTIALPKPAKVTAVKVQIVDVYKGAMFPDTCISELRVVTR